MACSATSTFYLERVMGRYFLWFALIVLSAGCSGGSGEDDDEDGRSGATPRSSAAQHASVAPGTCSSCHGTTARGKNAGHIPTTASCDVCHRTTGWEPATINHNNVASGACATCHDGISARGKSLSHISTAAACDTCHLTTGWVPATMGHSSVVPGTCATCHNGISARGKTLTHMATTSSCDACHLTTGWVPTTIAISTIDFPVEAVLVSLASTASSYAASATDSAGNSLMLSVGLAPGAEKSEPLVYGEPLLTFTRSAILRKNGNITSTKHYENFYSANPFYLFGNLNNLYGTSNTMRVTTQLPLPSTGRVGASGVLYKGRNYLSNAALSPDRWFATWSLEADSATTAWLCLGIGVTPASSAAVTEAETDCYLIDQTGNVIGFKADMTENGMVTRYR